jgi:hypothetical protein
MLDMDAHECFVEIRDAAPMQSERSHASDQIASIMHLAL